nr:PH domain-containing protein [Ardenticatena sp.]
MGYVEELLGKDETILFQTRQHPIVIARAVLVYGVLALGIFVVSVVLWRAQQNPSWLILLVADLFVLARLALVLVAWSNERYIITNRRVLKVEGIFNKQATDSSLEKVNDVVLEQSVLGRLLGYGDIHIITGSDIGVNHFERIHHPVRFKQAMLNAKTDLHTSSGRAPDTTRTLEDDVFAAIERLAELRQRGLITEEEFERKKAELLARL